MMENVFEILKDLPKPEDYVLLTVAKGSAAGEKAILAEKKIIWESKENGFFSAHFSEAGDLKKCGLYEIREQKVYNWRAGASGHLWRWSRIGAGDQNRDYAWMEGHGS